MSRAVAAPVHVITRRFADPHSALLRVTKPDNVRLDVYRAQGGYEQARAVVTQMRPRQVIDLVKASKLRGRGGAGFSTGTKWGYVPRDGQPHYLVVNGDEGEPGTFKDRVILTHDPHGLIEGVIIAAFAIEARSAYIYIRGEFEAQIAIMQRAVDEAYAAGLLGAGLFGASFDLDVRVARGAGAYICGEETALLESIEGRRGHPRLKPPFPAVTGLWGRPTVINNVETLAALPAIVEHGPEWFASLGSPTAGGTRLVGVSGHVARPGVYELPLAATLREVVYDYAGGPGRKNPATGGYIPVKAVIPGGSSAPVLTAEELDISLGFDELAAKGTMAGSGGVIVMDASVCMVRACANLMHFYAHESCGQCTPCREGTNFLLEVCRKIEQGNGKPGDLDLLQRASRFMLGTTICALSEAAALPLRGFLRAFRHEFEEHIRTGRCPYPAVDAIDAAAWNCAPAEPHWSRPWPRG